ncbi:MAG: outer membrane beta-barrel protein [Lewinellaceae bacterium]|nr:outer membrane beta-barrel protein [Lewinellaceae bacterium]
MQIRIWLFLLFLSAGLSGASGQIRYQLGFTAGVNYASVRSDQFTTASGLLAPVIGCSFVVAPNGRFELNQEIILTMRGARARAVDFRAEQKPAEQTYTYNYYTFETGLFGGFRPGRDLPILLQAGGYFGANFHTLNRSRRELMIGDYQNINNAVRAVDLNDAFAGLDYGPALGLMLGEGRFRANARYYLGLKNLYSYIDFVAPGPASAPVPCG